MMRAAWELLVEIGSKYGFMALLLVLFILIIVWLIDRQNKTNKTIQDQGIIREGVLIRLNKETQTQSAAREQSLLEIIGNLNITLANNTAAITALTNEIEKKAEAAARSHGYMKDEHRTMIDILGNMEKTSMLMCERLAQ